MCANAGCGRVIVFEHLDIGAKLHAEVAKLGGPDASNNRGRTEGIGDPIFPREFVEGPCNVSHHLGHEQLRQPLERQTMRTCAEPLLHSAYRPLNFADVTVSWNDIHSNGEDGVSSTLELVVPVDVANLEATGVVNVDIVFEVFDDRTAGAIHDRVRDAVAYVAGDAVQKTNTLHKQEIDAQSHMLMVLEDRSRNGHCNEFRRARRSRRSCGFALLVSDLRPVDDGGAASVVHLHRAVVQQILAQDLLEEQVPRPTEFAVESAGVIRCFDLPTCEQFLLFCHRRYHSVGSRRVVSIVSLKNEKSRRVFVERHYRPIETMHIHGRRRGRVHGHAADFANFGM